MNNKVIVIGGKDFQIENFFHLEVPFILIQNKEDTTEYQRSIATEIIEIDYTNISFLKETVINLVPFHNILAIFSFTEYGLYPTAVVAEDLNLKSNCTLPACELSRNKLMMREVTKDALYSSPVKFGKAINKDDAMEFLHQHSVPFIIKPNLGVGSFGVKLVNSEQDISEYLSLFSTSDSDEFICEHYISGMEYSVEAISKNGNHEIIAITEKLIDDNFVEYGHNQPADLPEHVAKKIGDATLELLSSIHHKHGPSHTEVKVKNNEVYIIETQTRTGGDRIWQLTELTTGINLYKRTITDLLNIAGYSLPEPPQFKVAISRYPILSPGKIDSINTDFTPTPEIIENQFHPTPGQRVCKAQSSLQRLGFLVIGADTLVNAQSIYNEHLSLLNIRYEDHEKKNISIM